jgi:hypothetical protein
VHGNIPIAVYHKHKREKNRVNSFHHVVLPLCQVVGKAKVNEMWLLSEGSLDSTGSSPNSGEVL